MSSRRPARQLVAAVLLGVLVGGGLMAVTPAGAQVSSAVATKWKKIWKKELKPLAARTFYTKKQSDAAYQAKGAYEVAGSGYSKSETYTKAEVDAKLAPLVSSVSATAGGNQDLALSSTAQVARSVSLMPPANGSVIVSSSGYLFASSTGIFRCSITTGTAIDQSALQIASLDGITFQTLAGTRSYPVTKGTLLTVNLVCDASSGAGSVGDTSLAAIFAPS